MATPETNPLQDDRKRARENAIDEAIMAGGALFLEQGVPPEFKAEVVWPTREMLKDRL